MNMDRLKQQWLSYRERVIPRDASSAQLTETRRAFYAGAQAFYGITMSVFDDTGNPDDVTDFDLSVMAGLDAELRQFAEQVKKGLA